MRQSLISARFLCLTLAICFSAQQAISQDLNDNVVKKNISPITNPLQVIRSIQPMMFEYNNSQYSHLKLPSGPQYGFVAEEFQRVFPAMVYKKPYSFMSGKNSYKTATVKSIDMESLIPILVASIKEQQAAIDQLKAEIEMLKKR